MHKTALKMPLPADQSAQTNTSLRLALLIKPTAMVVSMLLTATANPAIMMLRRCWRVFTIPRHREPDTMEVIMTPNMAAVNMPVEEENANSPAMTAKMMLVISASRGLSKMAVSMTPKVTGIRYTLTFCKSRQSRITTTTMQHKSAIRLGSISISGSNTFRYSTITRSSMINSSPTPRYRVKSTPLLSSMPRLSNMAI